MKSQSSAINEQNYCSTFNRLCPNASDRGICLISACNMVNTSPKSVGESFVNLINRIDSLSAEKLNILDDLLFILRTNNVENCTEICDGDCSSCNSSYKNFNWRHREDVEEAEF